MGPSRVVFTLVLLTFSLYSVYWFFETWREIKRQDGDARKNPTGHALSTMIPVYGLYRVYLHMRTIVQLVRSSGGHTTLQPGNVVIALMIASVFLGCSGLPHLGWLLIVGTAIVGGIVAWAQVALNQAWRLQPEGARVRPMHRGEWVAMVVGGTLTAVAVFL